MHMGADELMRRTAEDWARTFEAERQTHAVADDGRECGQGGRGG